MSQERFYILAAKVLNKEALPSELADFQNLISENPEWKAVFANLEELWASEHDHQSVNISSTEEAYLLHLAGLKDQVKDFEDNNEFALQSDEDFQLYPGKKRWYQKWQSYAAVMALVLIGTLSFKFYNDRDTVSEAQKPISEINVNRGAKTSLQLPDGSHVWVNSDSKLSYPETFQGGVREVFLEGEAYFDVVKDPAHPFIVHTSGIDVRVLGTAFNVKAYNAEPTIEATLVHGMIEVTKKNQPNASKVILKPHEKLIFNRFAGDENKTDSRLILSNASAQKNISKPAIIITPLLKNIADTAIIETSWVYNRLSFEDENLEDLAVKMERWFNVKITINSDKIKSHKLTGSFQDETIEEALKELQYLVSFSYKISGKEVMINRK